MAKYHCTIQFHLYKHRACRDDSTSAALCLVVAKGGNPANNGDSSSLHYPSYGGSGNFERLPAFDALRKGGVSPAGRVAEVHHGVNGGYYPLGLPGRRQFFISTPPLLVTRMSPFQRGFYEKFLVFATWPARC